MSRSFVVVFPEEPVIPTTRTPGARRAPCATRPNAVWTSSTAMVARPGWVAQPSTATAPGRHGGRGVVVTVGELADPGDVEAARSALPRVRGHDPSTTTAAVLAAVELTARDLHELPGSVGSPRSSLDGRAERRTHGVPVVERVLHPVDLLSLLVALAEDDDGVHRAGAA